MKISFNFESLVARDGGMARKLQMASHPMFAK